MIWNIRTNKPIKIRKFKNKQQIIFDNNQYITLPLDYKFNILPPDKARAKTPNKYNEQGGRAVTRKVDEGSGKYLSLEASVSSLPYPLKMNKMKAEGKHRSGGLFNTTTSNISQVIFLSASASVDLPRGVNRGVKQDEDQVRSSEIVQHSKILVLDGVGYKIQLEDIGNHEDRNDPHAQLMIKCFIGYRNPVVFEIPSNITVKIINNKEIHASSYSLQKLTLFLNKILQIKPGYKDKYKNKGFKWGVTN